MHVYLYVYVYASAYRYVHECTYVCMCVCICRYIYRPIYIFRFKVPTFVTTDNTPAASSKISVNVYHIARRNVLTGQYSALCSSRKAANNVDWEVKEKERVFMEY